VIGAAADKEASSARRMISQRSSGAIEGEAFA
jgi:hypothetical protein